MNKFMKLLSVALVFFCVQTASSQTNEDHASTVMDFAKAYNYLSPESIHHLFDEEYQKVHTVDKLDEFLDNKNPVLGMIEDCRMIASENGRKSYIMKGGKSIMIMKFEFSSDNKITFFETETLHESLPTY